MCSIHRSSKSANVMSSADTKPWATSVSNFANAALASRFDVVLIVRITRL